MDHFIYISRIKDVKFTTLVSLKVNPPTITFDNSSFDLMVLWPIIYSFTVLFRYLDTIMRNIIVFFTHEFTSTRQCHCCGNA
jgi:hypothetical protein